MHRIVQITDCHLFADPEGALRGIATWPRLAAVLDNVRRKVPQFDLLVITGDSAHDEELATYLRLRDSLADWADRVRIIPGNHDERSFLKAVFPSNSAGPEDPVTFLDRWDEWQVIGLDSQRAGETPGSLGDAQIRWLREELNRTPDLNTLLFLHHPPIAVQSAWLDRIGLLDADLLASVLRDYPRVRLVGCGHVHQELTGTLAGTPVFTTPSVGPPFRPRVEQLEIDTAPAGYRVIELLPDGEWITQVLRCGISLLQKANTEST